MKSFAEIQRLVRERSALPPAETERILSASFFPSRAVRFVCEHYQADRLAVLDLGCAMGQHLIHFGPGSVGLDAIESNVGFARSLGLEAVIANVEDHFPTFPTQFDAIFASNLLEHLVAPHLFLLRLRRLLKPDGRVFIHVPTIPPVPVMDRLIKRFLGHNGYLASEHIYAFTPRVGAFLLQRAGFSVIDVAFVAARDHPVLRFIEPLFLEAGISAMFVGQCDPEFTYPEKRVATFTPEFMAPLDARR